MPARQSPALPARSPLGSPRSPCVAPQLRARRGPRPQPERRTPPRPRPSPRPQPGPPLPPHSPPDPGRARAAVATAQRGPGPARPPTPAPPLPARSRPALTLGGLRTPAHPHCAGWETEAPRRTAPPGPSSESAGTGSPDALPASERCRPSQPARGDAGLSRQPGARRPHGEPALAAGS